MTETRPNDGAADVADLAAQRHDAQRVVDLARRARAIVDHVAGYAQDEDVDSWSDAAVRSALEGALDLLVLASELNVHRGHDPAEPEGFDLATSEAEGLIGVPVARAGAVPIDVVDHALLRARGVLGLLIAGPDPQPGSESAGRALWAVCGELHVVERVAELVTWLEPAGAAAAARRRA